MVKQFPRVHNTGSTAEFVAEIQALSEIDSTVQGAYADVGKQIAVLMMAHVKAFRRLVESTPALMGDRATFDRAVIAAGADLTAKLRLYADPRVNDERRRHLLKDSLARQRGENMDGTPRRETVGYNLGEGMEIPDDACVTAPNGDCVASGPCMHSPEIVTSAEMDRIEAEAPAAIEVPGLNGFQPYSDSAVEEPKPLPPGLHSFRL